MSADAARDGRATRTFGAIPFHPREVRIVEAMARWMAMLGRFQVLAGGFLMLVVVGAALVLGVSEAIDEGAPAATDTTPPVVTLGEVSPEVVTGIAVGVLLLGWIVLRQGVLLTDAAEDLESVAHGAPTREGGSALGEGVRRLTWYFAIETVLVAALLALLVWSAGFA